MGSVKSIQRELKRVRDDLLDEVDDAVERGLDATEHEAKRNLVRHDAVASGATYRGFRQRKTTVGVNGVRRTLTNVTPHAKFVERGTGDKGFYRAPSMSTSLVRAITTWIHQKPSFRRVGGPPEEAAVWIARSISGQLPDQPSGTAPQPFMGPAWRRGQRVVKHQARMAVKEVLR